MDLSTTTGRTTNQLPLRNGARRDRLRGAMAGTLAMLAFLVIVDVLRRLTDVTSLLDTMSEAMLLWLPISWFEFGLDTFGKNAKTLQLVGLLAVVIGIGAFLGYVHAKQTAGARRPMWLRTVSIGIGVFAFSTLFMYWFLSDQRPDQVSGTNVLPIVWQMALASAAFAVVLAMALSLLRRQDPLPDSVAAVEEAAGELSRRRLVTRVALGASALAGVGVLGSAVAKVANRHIVGLTAPGEISPAITPIGDFYVISKNFVDPDPDRGENWSVKVDGVVGKEMEFTRADLEAISTKAYVSTLTCISNEVGGPLIGTAEWVGAPLAEVLRTVGVGEGARKVIFEGEDDYTDSITLERAMMPEPMLVWQMNGVPLPRLHGTPVRIIVPGIYGMKNVKWLTKITVSNEDYQGFWQTRGWSDPAIVKTSSRFDVPSNRDVLESGSNLVGGVAFGGDRGVLTVEVSVDDGDTWQEASIKENPSPAGLSWVTWEMDWPAKPGTYKMQVRATDGMGDLQTAEKEPTLPDGSSGYHKIEVIVQ